MPSGRQLSELLWRFMKYAGDYDGMTPLTDMFEAALTSGVPRAAIKNFLEANLMCGDVPDIYNSMCVPFWHRIYTTNVDDLLPLVYRRMREPLLRCLSYPKHHSKERDPSLNEIQAIYVNGQLPCDPTEVTFSFMQYARAANVHAPLYDQFVSDYSVHPTIFVGTQLNEPLLQNFL